MENSKLPTGLLKYIYSVLCPEKLENKVSCQDNTEEVRDIWHILQL